MVTSSMLRNCVCDCEGGDLHVFITPPPPPTAAYAQCVINFGEYHFFRRLSRKP